MPERPFWTNSWWLLVLNHHAKQFSEAAHTIKVKTIHSNPPRNRYKGGEFLLQSEAELNTMRRSENTRNSTTMQSDTDLAQYRKTKTQLTLCRGRRFKIKLTDIGKQVQKGQAIVKKKSRKKENKAKTLKTLGNISGTMEKPTKLSPRHGESTMSIPICY